MKLIRLTSAGLYRRAVRALLPLPLLMPLAACPATVLGVPTFVATEVAPRAVNGKGLAEDGVDAATGKDCRLIEGTVRRDRKLCETKGSPETEKDFKGMMGK